MKSHSLLREPPKIRARCLALLCCLAATLAPVGAKSAEAPDGPPRDFDGPPPDFGGPPPFIGGGPGRGGPRGMGPSQEKAKLVERFDKDGDKVLSSAERKAAREYLATEGQGRIGGRFGGPRFGPRGQDEQPPAPGPKLTPADVKNFGTAPLYDPAVLRTFFLEFEDADWEKELAAFKNTDVDVPAKLTVDGKTYSDVGVHFRGMSSFMMVGEGRKRSLNVSLDFVHHDQQLGGYRTLNLLNSHEDPTFLRSVLSYQISRGYIPAPRANFARVVINGESWGVYVNVEQFNKDFVKEWFGTTKGARWKVPGSPGGQGSLAYLGDDPAAYKRIYQIKSKDNPKAWKDLIHLCRVLNETTPDQLEQALAPLLDIDGALKFLAIQNALINNDGYWIRTSDYALYEEENGRFHVLPQDSNENFVRPEGPGMGGFGPRGRGGPGGFRRPGGPEGERPAGGRPDQGPGAPGGRPDFRGGAATKGVELDPLVALDDASKPLISKLLAVPSLRTRYLGYVRDIAQKWLDWERLGPIAEQYHSLIAADVKTDTRKLESTDAFLKGVMEDVQGEGGFGPRGRGTIGIKTFADQRRKYLLDYLEGKKTAAADPAKY